MAWFLGAMLNRRSLIAMAVMMILVHQLVPPASDVRSAHQQRDDVVVAALPTIRKDTTADVHIEIENADPPARLEVSSTQQVGDHHAASASPPPAASPSTKDCFHNKVMFQPVFCTKVADILSKALEIGGSERRRWNVAHIGSREGLIRLAELVDVFGDVAHGSQAVGRLLREHGVQQFCGSCCECVAAAEFKATVSRYNATLVLPLSTKDVPEAVSVGYFAPNQAAVNDGNMRNLIVLDANDVGRCPEALAIQLRNTTKALLMQSDSKLDVLTVDAWRCDMDVVAAVAEVVSSRKPNFLEVTMVAGDVSYEKVVQSLEANYACYFLTTKPEGKKFRGIRQPNYPLAVRVSGGCWRGIYDSFKQERYHLTCHKHSDVALTAVMAAFTRMTHKGIHAGCSVGQRGEKLKNFS